MNLLPLVPFIKQASESRALQPKCAALLKKITGEKEIKRKTYLELLRAKKNE